MPSNFHVPRGGGPGFSGQKWGEWGGIGEPGRESKGGMRGGTRGLHGPALLGTTPEALPVHPFCPVGPGGELAGSCTLHVSVRHHVPPWKRPNEHEAKRGCSVCATDHSLRVDWRYHARHPETGGRLPAARQPTNQLNLDADLQLERPSVSLIPVFKCLLCVTHE